MSNDASAEAEAFLSQLGSSTGGGGGASKQKKKKNKHKGKESKENQDNSEVEAEAGVEAGVGVEEGLEVGVEGTKNDSSKGSTDDEKAAADTAASEDKKKKKKKNKKQQDGSQGQGQGQSTAHAATSKSSAAAKLAAERIERERKERERIAREEEEEALREKEEREKELEEQKRIEAEKEKKRIKKQEKKERARLEGKPVTKAEKAKEKERREKRQQLIDAGLIDESVLESTANGQGSGKGKGKVAYEDKKKKQKRKQLNNSKQEEIGREPQEVSQTVAANGNATANHDESQSSKEGKGDDDQRQDQGQGQHQKGENALGDDADDDDDWETTDAVEKLAKELEDETVDIAATYTNAHSTASANTKNNAKNTASTIGQANGTISGQTKTKKKNAKKVDEEPVHSADKTKGKDKTKKEKDKSKGKGKSKGKKGKGDDDGDDDSDPDPDPDSHPDSDSRSGSDSASDPEGDSDNDSDDSFDRKARENNARKLRAKESRLKRMEEAKQNRDPSRLRSPICCVLGHVDTGKTKLLDKIRRSHVQEGEAGGITQQIGATYFPMDNLRTSTDLLNRDLKLDYRVPGLLVIDTPGHESFSNLRSRGSGLCDVAILVVDIMHGLEQQTHESIKLLRHRRTPFVVALNKVDRLNGWKSQSDTRIRHALAKQSNDTMQHFQDRVKAISTQLMEKGLNPSLYYDNKDYQRNVSMVPTSAHTGEGIPDLLLLIVQLTQQMMAERLMFIPELECTVIEVKKVEGHGTTIDVVVVNGELYEDDTIVVAGMNGPIVTEVRSLLTPQPLKEIRVKGDYVHHKQITGAMGVKIAANDLEHAVAGTSLFVVRGNDDVEELKDAVMEDMEKILQNVSTEGRGVCVKSSTLGSLEALLAFLRSSEIPVANAGIGPVTRRDVTQASIMLEHQREYATILAFDVKVGKDVLAIAEDQGVRIFTAEIIYHLFDKFTGYIKEVREKTRAGLALSAVFPCILRIIPGNVFNAKAPIVVGVEIIEGICKVGTPLVIPDKKVPDPETGGEKMLELGRIESIEYEHKPLETVSRGKKVCIKIQPNADQSHIQFGRHFDEKSEFYSKLTRESIDLLKQHFKNDLAKEDWQTVIKLKKVFGIV